MDKTVSIEIPAPPEGHEAFFNFDGIEVACTHKVVNGQWMTAPQGASTKDILARKKLTMADWANEQELFKALAKMRHGVGPAQLAYRGEETWFMDYSSDYPGVVVALARPPFRVGNTLILTDGKWELA